METIASATTAVPRSGADRLLARLARTTSSGSFIPEIDGLRTVAVMAVIFFHLDHQMKLAVTPDVTSQAVAGLARRGFFGVPIFFAISAFIISLPFAQHHFNGAKASELSWFYRRRLTRLEPPYMVNLILLWLVGGLMGSWTLAQNLPGLAASLVYQHNQIFGYFSTVNSVAWSLEVEFQFYLLAPLFTFVFAVKRAWLRRLLIIVPVLAAISLRDPGSRRVELSLLGQCEAFAVGFLLVDLHLTRGRDPRPAGLVWDVAGLLAWAALIPALNLQPVLVRQTVLAGLLFVAMLGSLQGIWLSRILANRWICTFGGMCYSYYLYHQWLMSLFIPTTKQVVGTSGPYWLQFAVQFALLFPIIILFCTLLFICVEKPCMQRGWLHKPVKAA